MNNLLPSKLEFHEKYDLKGSTFKRKASQKERQKPLPTLKDLDFSTKHPHVCFWMIFWLNCLGISIDSRKP